MKSKTTAILLCFFLGALGIHRFYLGHTLIGVIQLLTIGGFGFWALVDFVRLITGSLPVNSVEADTPKDDSTEEKQTVVQEKVAEYTESQKTEEAKKEIFAEFDEGLTQANNYISEIKNQTLVDVKKINNEEE